jgi:hypothetical protein
LREDPTWDKLWSKSEWPVQRFSFGKGWIVKIINKVKLYLASMIYNQWVLEVLTPNCPLKLALGMWKCWFPGPAPGIVTKSVWARENSPGDSKMKQLGAPELRNLPVHCGLT